MMTHKALQINNPGVLSVVERSTPEGLGTILRLACSVISPLDQQISDGLFPPAHTYPLIPGTTAVMSDENGSHYFVFAEGFGGGITQDGCHQEFLNVPEKASFPIPEGLSAETVACAMNSFLCAISIFARKEHEVKGKRVLILGGNSSVGQAAAVCANWYNHDVTLATRNGNSVLGKPSISYEQLVKSNITGFDIVIDPLGGAYSHLATMRSHPGCRHYVIGLSGGINVELFGPALLLNSYNLIGFNLMTEAQTTLPELVRRAFDLMISSNYAVSEYVKFPIIKGSEAYVMAKAGSKKILLTL
jgi:NADPH:quinone reductase-like Zn-dependent oxidoreductase